MRFLDYQRSVIAYHGCDSSVRDKVIQGGGDLDASQNEYDWLGHGIYFWEHGPERALEWAKQQNERGRIKKPAVLGAILHLGQCFDLLDAAYTDVLRRSYPDFCEFVKSADVLTFRLRFAIQLASSGTSCHHLMVDELASAKRDIRCKTRLASDRESLEGNE